MKKRLPIAWLITDSKTIDPVEAAKKLSRGSGVILRDYDLPEAKRFALGKILKKICTEKNIPFLVARDVELANALKADGMHFPEFMFAEMRRLRAKKPGWIITIAAHSRRAAKNAYDAGADAVLISPVFQTTSHYIKKPLGSIRAAHYIYRGQKAYALGGVRFSTWKGLKPLGFHGFAGISWGKGCGGSATVASLTAKK